MSLRKIPEVISEITQKVHENKYPFFPSYSLIAKSKFLIMCLQLINSNSQGYLDPRHGLNKRVSVPLIQINCIDHNMAQKELTLGQ